MHSRNIMMLLRLFSIFVVVYGQLSIDELFFFNSKHALAGNCTDFQYTFADLRINSYKYNQLVFHCESSSVILRNEDYTFPFICLEDEDYLQSFRIHFPQVSQTSIQVNQLQLHGIELCSLDDLIRNVYHEHAYYRSRWALLINVQTEHHQNHTQDQHHIAIVTNGDMTFMLFLQSSESQQTMIEDEIELIFPNENSFKFNRSSNTIWRIDQGYVRHPQSLYSSAGYQLSKSKFTLFSNETFMLYGTQLSYPKRFLVSIDETSVVCKYDYILQCTFPILPLTTHETHEPLLKVLYNRMSIFNSTLKLIPRTRLDHLPINHSLTNIETFEVNLTETICVNESLKSFFTLIVHLWIEDINGIAQYQKNVTDDLAPVDCRATAKIGQKIQKIVNSISIDDILSLDVDLTHQWYDQRQCRAEQTRIAFI